MHIYIGLIGSQITQLSLIHDMLVHCRSEKVDAHRVNISYYVGLGLVLPQFFQWGLLGGPEKP